jgi:hypothetical protein
MAPTMRFSPNVAVVDFIYVMTSANFGCYQLKGEQLGTATIQNLLFFPRLQLLAVQQASTNALP